MRQRHSSWFLGIDAGTGSCKSIVVDEQARLLGLGASTYPGEEDPAAWREQAPNALMTGVVTSVRRAVAQAGVSPAHCAGISVGTAMHSVLALDEARRPLTDIITWADGRAIEQAKAVYASAQASPLYHSTGCPVYAMYPLYKIIWLREERPALFQRAAYFVSAKEYLVAQLTGEWASDYCMAAGTGLFDIYHLRWHAPALQLAGIDESQLAPVAPPVQRFPRLRGALAEQMGLPVETPLVLGSTDAANSSLGAGAVSSSQATCMIGTSGAFRMINRKPVLDREGQIWCYTIDPEHWLSGVAANNGGLALAWLLDVVNEHFPGPATYTFETLLQEAQTVNAGADGVLCLPLFARERSSHWNRNARALFVGMTLDHGLGHLARALVEGVAFHFRSLVDVLVGAGIDPDQIRASGGFTRSDFWVQLMSDVLRRELTVPASGETSALGAALWAMVGAGVVERLEDMGRFVAIDKTFQPAHGSAVTYDALYALYLELYERVEPVYDKIAALQEVLVEKKEEESNGQDRES